MLVSDNQRLLSGGAAFAATGLVVILRRMPCNSAVLQLAPPLGQPAAPTGAVTRSITIQQNRAVVLDASKPLESGKPVDPVVVKQDASGANSKKLVGPDRELTQVRVERAKVTLVDIGRDGTFALITGSLDNIQSSGEASCVLS